MVLTGWTVACGPTTTAIEICLATLAFVRETDRRARVGSFANGENTVTSAPLSAPSPTKNESVALRIRTRALETASEAVRESAVSLILATSRLAPSPTLLESPAVASSLTVAAEESLTETESPEDASSPSRETVLSLTVTRSETSEDKNIRSRAAPSLVAHESVLSLVCGCAPLAEASATETESEDARMITNCPTPESETETEVAAERESVAVREVESETETEVAAERESVAVREVESETETESAAERG